MNRPDRIDLMGLREQISELRGKRFWRGLEELAATPAFREALEREFPAGAESWDDPAGRRNFLKLMGASLAMAGLGACTRQPAEAIVPYVDQPEAIVPGQPLFYASAMPLGGFGTGVLVEAHLGRPTKIEGNRSHPASLGATDPFQQASLLGLYDPDRSQTIRHIEEIHPWGDFLETIRAAMEAMTEEGGEGLRFLTGTVTSPTLAGQIEALRPSLPGMRWHQYEAANRDPHLAGARLAFGEPVGTWYRLEEADVIVSLEADFLASGPAHLRYAREFSRRRQVDSMNRLYVAESAPTVTGSKADHRLPVRSGEVEALAGALAVAVGADARNDAGPAEHREWIGAVAGIYRRTGAAAR